MNPPPHLPSAAPTAGEGQGASYELLGKLAVGGMAELFLARAPMRDGSRGPVVVLKRILPHLAEDPEFVRMFRDEAYLAATLRHPNIVRVFDIGKHGDDYFFTMEYAHGENLRALLRATQKRGESIPLGHIITIALGVTAALHHAHEQVDHEGRPLQIVHRDVSPTNVIVGYDGSLKIVDFGIAKAAAGTHVTQAGMLKGKASYMSPEQCRSGQVDRRSDVFSIGILLYEMTTLTRLFRGDNELAILHQVLSGTVEAPSVRRPGYPPDLERVVLKALAQDADERYQTALDLQSDLMRFAAQHQLRPSPPGLSQFMRGLFGDKPLPWDDEEDGEPAAAASASMNLTTSPAPGTGQVDETDLTRNRAGQTPGRQPAEPPAAPRAAAARRGPGARAAAPRRWRPGGNATGPAAPAPAARPPARPAKPPPPAPTAAAPPPARKTGPRPAAPLRAPAPSKARAQRPPRPAQPIAQPRPVAPPRPVAKAPVPSPAGFAPPVPSLNAGAHAAVTEVPPVAGTPRPVTPGHTPAQGSASAPSGYSPPAPSYEMEEIKTSLANSTLDAQKTQVAGTSAAEIRKFIDAAAPAALGPRPGDDLAMKTQVAPTSAADIQAFIAAAPPASFGGPAPNLAEKTQVAPTSAAEMQAFVAGLAQPSVAEPEDLFATPAAPTRPAPPASPRPSAAAAVPSPPRAGTPAQAGASAPVIEGPLPPPGGGPPRRDTIMKAPSQPAALGGAPVPRGPGGGPARPGLTVSAEQRAADDLEDAATVRMSLNEYEAAVAEPQATAPSPVASAPQPPAHGQAAHLPATQPQPAMQPAPATQQPRGHWNGQPALNQTAPMAIMHAEDEPLVVPGRRAKTVALIITLVGGVLLGGFITWYFVLR